jgi:putative membrane protein
MRNLLIAVVATLALSACAAPSTSDFVQKAAMIDMCLIEAGKLATQKGQSEAVKQFGRQMVDAHSKTTEELKGILQIKNIKAELPTKLDSKHQKLNDDLNSVSARDFDIAYARQQVDCLKDARRPFKKYAERGRDAYLRQFAGKTLPTIEYHWEEAKKLLHVEMHAAALDLKG